MNPQLLTPQKESTKMVDKLIITGASASFGPSLLALLGSLTLNWPDHPPVLVYDLGMDDETLAILEENHIEVRKVPPFVPHWRKHFTWKVWCWNDAPARDVLWLDAGVVILQPYYDVFDAIDRIGYFVNATFYLLSETATDAACKGCGVDPSFRSGKMTFNGGVVGFRKEGVIGDILKEALRVASVEEYIKSTIPLGRHDQTILSLLIYKHIANPIMLDTMIYAGWESSRQVQGQKAWQHRRSLTIEDMEHYPGLKTLGIYHQTDKFNESHSFAGLSYLDVYEKYLAQFRNKKVSLLEISVRDGASLRTWKSYFKKGNIYGIDIDPRCKALEEKRIEIAIGSQDDEVFLRSCFGSDTKFDVIIDDGSHVNKMTLASFVCLFNERLNNGGVYIIEDLGCSYDKLQTDHHVADIWPGMKYNDPLKSLDNDRKDMDAFFLEKISDLDHRMGNVLSIHFWSMTCVITKI